MLFPHEAVADAEKKFDFECWFYLLELVEFVGIKGWILLGDDRLFENEFEEADQFVSYFGRDLVGFLVLEVLVVGSFDLR